MNSDDQSIEEQDTLQFAMKSQKRNDILKQPKRFEAITKKLYTPQSTISPYKNLTFHKYSEQSEPNPSDILHPRMVILNNQQFILRCQLTVTSKGICYVLRLKDRWINLSWLHSIKKIQKTKVLLLYYFMNPIVKDKKPTLQPQLLEFKQKQQLQQFYKCVVAIHSSTHDQQIQKLYHKLI